MLKRYDTAFYVVTPSKYLHEFKTDDDFAKDPIPEQSLYLPDCLIGAVDGSKFNIKGKDASKGSLGAKMSMSHEFSFKAHTAADAAKWHQVIGSVAGQVTNEQPSSTPSSPAGGSVSEAGSPVTQTTSAEKSALGAEQGVVGQEQGVASTTGTTAAGEKV